MREEMFLRMIPPESNFRGFYYFFLSPENAKIRNGGKIMKKLWESVAANVSSVLEFLAVIVFLFAIAYILDRMAARKRNDREAMFSTRKVAMIGMFSAISMVLMMFEIPLPFAPSFYKLDFSELPILIGTFAFGPMAGVMMEFVKILLKLLVKGISTAFVGELANFAVGCSFILPASAIYAFKKSKKSALIACVAGTLVMTVFGTLFNAVYLLPAFAKLYGMPLDTILAMGEKVNPLVKEGSILSFVAACVAPLNLLKGACVSIVTLFVYKPLSPIIKAGRK